MHKPKYEVGQCFQDISSLKIQRMDEDASAKVNYLTCRLKMSADQRSIGPDSELYIIKIVTMRTNGQARKRNMPCILTFLKLAFSLEQGRRWNCRSLERIIEEARNNGRGQMKSVSKMANGKESAARKL